MVKINKINNGFLMNGIEFIFDGFAEKLNNNQAHFPTKQGVIFFDNSIFVDEQNFDSIDDLITFLYN